MQRIIINCILVIGTYLVPLYIFNRNQDNYSSIATIQWIVFFVLLLGAIALTYLNHKNKSLEKGLYWVWLLFELLGILGMVYSAVILYLLFAFRNGIGF